MKKLILIVASLFTISALGAGKKHKHHDDDNKEFVRPYGVAGCGLGSLAFGRKDGQILAATTNGTSYNQLFAISSGTSNCVDGPVNEVAGNMDKFIMANKAALTADIARGNGETVTALSQMMRCSASGPQLGAVLQKNYGKIFSEDNAKANILTDNIITVLMNDADMASQCNLG